VIRRWDLLELAKRDGFLESSVSPTPLIYASGTRTHI
jgi:hypothetical protein